MLHANCWQHIIWSNNFRLRWILTKAPRNLYSSLSLLSCREGSNTVNYILLIVSIPHHRTRRSPCRTICIILCISNVYHFFLIWIELDQRFLPLFLLSRSASNFQYLTGSRSMEWNHFRYIRRQVLPRSRLLLQEHLLICADPRHLKNR